jgi:thiol:disulfide interchange protein DsbG
MRALLLCTIFGALSSTAYAGAPQCTLPSAGAIQVADQQVPPSAPLPSVRTSTFQTSQPAASEALAKLPASVAALPFVQHVVAAGAVVSDFGLSHGMHSIAARNGDQFMIFQITPDGQAAVSGALTELTSAQLATAAGGNVTPLASQHGMDTLFVRSGAQFQVFYVTPDKERVIPGVLWNSAGKDLTRDQVANVPGAIPTVTVGDVPASKPGAPSAAGVAAVLPLVQKASSGTVGSASAPHLWMVIDPQCIYSVRAYQMLYPFVVAGKLQLSIIPISVLDYEDKGQSTKSALALLSKSPDQLVSAWQAGSVNDPPDPAAAERLQANHAIAQAIGLQGTPTLIWKKQDGTEGRLDGVPTSIDALISSIGS